MFVRIFVSILTAGLVRSTYAITVGVVECFQRDDVGVADDAHDLQFAILFRRQADK